MFSEFNLNYLDRLACLEKLYPISVFHFRSEPSCVASGNWGCGAFGGDPQLKSLLQLMGAAENGRDVLYFTFGDEKLRDDIFDVFTLLKNKNVSVGSLYNVSYEKMHFVLLVSKSQKEIVVSSIPPKGTHNFSLIFAHQKQ